MKGFFHFDCRWLFSKINFLNCSGKAFCIWPSKFVLLEMLRFAQSKVFTNGMPSKSTMELQKHHFKLAGEIMVMSVLQDGQAPNFLDPLVFKYLTGKLEIQEITSPAHKEFCEKVSAKLEYF